MQSILLSNKVVLGFESEYSGVTARNWIRSYNLKSSVLLTLCNELAHSLYIVQFKASDLSALRLQLLDSSPLGSGEK